MEYFAQNHTFAICVYKICACLGKCIQSLLGQSGLCKPEGCIFKNDPETGKCRSAIGIRI